MVNKSPDKRITDILSAAVLLFMKNGYEGTSMDSIAQLATSVKRQTNRQIR